VQDWRLDMGHRTTQRILTCDVCGVTPDDGEYMWEMGSEFWCEKCCNDEHEDKSTNMAEFEGATEALNNLAT